MVEFVNVNTGCKMYVDNSRIEEYKAMGHTIASSDVKTENKPVRKRKTTTKR